MPAAPPEQWLARMDLALAKPEARERRAAMASLLADIHDEQTHLRERLEMLSSASFEGLFIHDGGVVIDVNQRLCEMHGYERDEMLGPDTLRRCVAPEDVPAVRRRMAENYEGEYIVTGVRKDGSRFRSGVQTKQGRLGDRPVRVVAVRDVTKRERVNTLLRESEARFRELADAAFDFTLFSRDGIILDIRGAFERVLGRKAADLVGRPVFDFMAPSAVPAARKLIGGNKLGFIEVMAIDSAGNLIPTEAFVVASTLDGQPVRVAGIRDLRPGLRLEAERLTLEQQVQRGQRLHSLGVLAGGIAHDFNNLLTGVLGNADYVRDNVTEPSVREATQAIIDAAQRAAALTRQMLAYAGKHELGPREPVDVGAVFSEMRTLLDATLSKKARIEVAIDPDTFAMGDRTTLGQVFMNLLTNASDALMDRPGDISVRVRRTHEVDARWDHAQGATVGTGDWVLIEVRDSGVGMNEATRGRIFEPFFSTKAQGHGLGLAACLGIVSAHGGAILVESELGRGSRFSILLPATTPSARAVSDDQPSPAPRICRVLVVDDEPVVRTQLRRLLELRGYKVTVAADGLSGLSSLEVEPPDVMILDLTMPDIDGAEVLRRMRAAGSTVPVVVSSGFVDTTLQHRLPTDAFQVFLPKPYGAAELVDAIERALPATPRR